MTAVALVAVFVLRPRPDAKVASEDQVAVFKRLERDYVGSVLLVRVGYDLVSGDYRRRFEGWGTGFFVSADGLIATNKHVVEPWKFEGDSLRILGRGYALDPDSVRVSAWPGGSQVFGGRQAIDYGTAFDSARGTLRHGAPVHVRQHLLLRDDSTVHSA